MAIRAEDHRHKRIGSFRWGKAMQYCLLPAGGRVGHLKESEMALISEWMQQCQEKVLDNAGIVREACFDSYACRGF